MEQPGNLELGTAEEWKGYFETTRFIDVGNVKCGHLVIEEWKMYPHRLEILESVEVMVEGSRSRGSSE